VRVAFPGEVDHVFVAQRIYHHRVGARSCAGNGVNLQRLAPHPRCMPSPTTEAMVTGCRNCDFDRAGTSANGRRDVLAQKCVRAMRPTFDNFGLPDGTCTISSRAERDR
jgi:hypothetical protein